MIPLVGAIHESPANLTKYATAAPHLGAAVTYLINSTAKIAFNQPL
jgi:hypothetical protein